MHRCRLHLPSSGYLVPVASCIRALYVCPTAYERRKERGGCMNWPDNITHAMHSGLLLAVFVVLSSLLYWLLRS